MLAISERTHTLPPARPPARRFDCGLDGFELGVVALDHERLCRLQLTPALEVAFKGRLVFIPLRTWHDTAVDSHDSAIGNLAQLVQADFFTVNGDSLFLVPDAAVWPECAVFVETLEFGALVLVAIVRFSIGCPPGRWTLVVIDALDN